MNDTSAKQSTGPTTTLPDDEVLRGEAFSLEHLEQHARALAVQLAAVHRGRGDRGLVRGIDQSAQLLREVHRDLLADVERGEPVTPDAEWLLDNYSVVEDQLREIREDLPQGYYHDLPKVAGGRPRVFLLSLELIIHTDSALDEETLVRFLQAFQETTPLSIGEIWAFPIMLRLGLVENLRRLATQMRSNRQCRGNAEEILARWQEGEQPTLDLLSLERCAPLVLDLLDLLEEQGSESEPRLRALERNLAEHDLSVDEIIRRAHQRQAANQVSIGNVITSMRLISALDWTAFFERTSLTERALRQDPTGVYAYMDPATRDSYRHVVEQLARQCPLSETATAQCAVALAQTAAQDNRPAYEQHIGFYLVDRGREHLEKEVGARPSIASRIRRFVERHALVLYLGSILVGTLAITAAAAAAVIGAEGGWGAAVIFALLALLPASELAVGLTNYAVANLLAPRRLPKLEFREGVPRSAATLVVVPALLTSRAEIAALVERLELHFLSNPEPVLRFALLTDFVDASERALPEDRELLQLARDEIRRLNEQYGEDGQGPFLLLHRERQWNPSERRWMGWERKRGKLMQLNRVLLGGAAEGIFDAVEGPLAAIAGDDQPVIRYVITLDADTQLPPGGARRLIGAIAHPLNRPRTSDEGITSGGYVILQPRLGVQLESANRSWYSRIFANSPGIDPYSTAASDVYQDLFTEGSFTGKGIYDVTAIEQALSGVFPENHILSHDLIEGCHARVGLLSDVELIDGFPARYDAEARRQHRWIRGDWQLLPWLLPWTPAEKGWRPNRLSLLSRWKIFDNLRRSLVPVALVALVAVGALLQPQAATLAMFILLLVLGFPLVAQVLTTLRNWPRGMSWAEYRRAWTGDLSRALVQTAVQITLLPHRAWYAIDAIARTLVRLTIMRRRLLEWETAAATEQRLSQSRWASLAGMWFSPVLAVVLFVFLPPAARLWLSPLLAAWLAAPAVAWWLSQPIMARPLGLGDADRMWLREMVRRSWSFFDRFVTAEDNWLPPDNFQEYPAEKIAHRVSPTNEGLLLVSALIARDFGLTALHEVVGLWERNIDAWGQLDRLRGHFFNWYDTTTLKPLHPRYVSTVDSGNFAACLMTLRTGIDELRQGPLFGPQQWLGVLDQLRAIEQACRELHPRGARLVSPVLDDLLESIGTLAALTEPPLDLSAWHLRLKAARQHCDRIAIQTEQFTATRAFSWSEVPELVRGLLRLVAGLDEDFQRIFPWAGDLALARKHLDSPSGQGQWPLPTPSAVQAWRELRGKLEAAAGLAALWQFDKDLTEPIAHLRAAWTQASDKQEAPTEALAWLDRLERHVTHSAAAADAIDARLARVARQMESWAREMDFSFLYNSQRRLFSIGFNVEDGQLDRAHYDMLASEARLASYLAIAKGDVDHRTWFRMGRPMTQTAGHTGLLSWGGTMFEFLMPQLFHRDYEGSLIWASCKAAVARQMEYGRQQSVPWGISECAFSALAANSDYHYKSFGVPGLGLKRGLAKDLVVSPYSTFLALPSQPRPAYDNLRHLEREGGLGRWGFFDAIDYTPERMPAGKRSLPVRCYMAHHQGMSLAALANLLDGDSVRRRFHAHPLGRAAELLLQERTPTATPLVEVHESLATAVQLPRFEGELVSRQLSGYETATPRTHLLSNGQYAVMLTNTGGGYSRYRDLAVTRWQSDPTRDHWGQFLYLRDAQTGRTWSATYQPTRARPDSYHVTYSIDKAEFHRRDGTIETHLEVTVSPENQAELRQLKLTNYGPRPVEIEVTSYAEVVLVPPAADESHPAFHKLFIETEYIPEELALIARRRPRDSAQPATWAVHVLAPGPLGGLAIEYESCRERFLGRGRTPDSPAALDRDTRLSGTTGAVLDPIFALRTRVIVQPNESAILAFTTAVAHSREEALALADQFHELRVVQRAFEMAWAFSQVELRHLHLSPAKAHLFQRLGAALLYPDPAWRADATVQIANRQGQSGLWRYGISGDVPLLLAHITKPDQLEVVRDLLAAHQYWRAHGLAVDLAIINDHPGSYLDALHELLVTVINELHRRPEGQPQSVFLLRGAQIPREDQTLLETAASVVLRCERGPLARQLESAATFAAARTPPAPAVAPAREAVASGYAASRNGDRDSLTAQRPPEHRLPPDRQRTFWNGWGGFIDGGRAYQMDLSGGRRPPQPWTNVLANPRFGCLVTESGGGYTWAVNSREFRLTTWANDPVADLPSEWLYLRDSRLGEIFRPLPQPGRDKAAEYLVEHARGYSRFRHSVRGLSTDTHIAVATEDAVKFVRVAVMNHTREVKQLAMCYYVEWVLGVHRRETQLHVTTKLHTPTGALLATNNYHPELSGQIALLHVLGPNRSATADRTEFLGRNGSPREPVGLSRPALSGKTGAGLDPCGAVQSKFALAPGERAEIVFLLGAGGDLAEVESILEKYRSVAEVEDEISRQQDRWNDVLGTIQVRTPNPALDLVVNHWLVYQTLACRMWARSAYYQSGGAYGFRDQLQDVMALVYSRPDLAREHLLRAAARQFEEGDVQHWWHPPGGRGTRTRFSDDYLWLPLVVSHYVRTTGDAGVLDEIAPLLHSPPLEAHEQERYEWPEQSPRSASLYEHCRLTLNRAFRLGPHGLPLIGCGDWNDGMNKVGELGQGESVWVGWFLLVILREFLPLMRERGDQQPADALAAQAETLWHNLEEHAWDGQWYRRSYFDDGTPLGSQQNDECRIDSISQSWAVFAGAERHRVRDAMESVWRQLVRPRDRLVLLLTPPFDQTPLDPGYIKGYLPGIRENGGQYTHAALWTVQAFAMLGDADRALDIFDTINPVLHAATPEGVTRYQVEPYVAAADVYGVAPHTGRGGWTWYTGSASWMYRVALETILGFELRGNRLAIRPRIPADWPQFEIHYRRGTTTYKITFRNHSAHPEEKVVVDLDGQRLPGDSFDLVDDGQVHEVLIARGGPHTALSMPDSPRSEASTSRSAASRVG